MTETPTLLDAPITEVLRDEARLDRVLRALESASSLSYLEAFERITNAAARRAENPGFADGPLTLRSLMAADVPELERVAAEVRVLEQRDEAVRRYQLDAGTGDADTEPVMFGRKGVSDAAHVIAHHPMTGLERYLRAREVGYPHSQENFRMEDEAAAHQGIDYAATLEKQHAAAQNAAGRTAQLDGRLAAAGDSAARVKLLDAELQAGDPDADAADRLFRHAELYLLEHGGTRERAVGYALEHADALDALDRLARRALAAPSESGPLTPDERRWCLMVRAGTTLKTLDNAAVGAVVTGLDAHPDGGREMLAGLRKRYAAVHGMSSGSPASQRPAPADEGLTDPAGAELRQLDATVREFMAEHELPEREHLRLFEAALHGHALEA